MSDTDEGEEDRSDIKQSKGTWTPQMEQEAPRLIATTREKALEGGFNMEPLTQLLLLWDVQLACAWVQTGPTGGRHVRGL